MKYLLVAAIAIVCAPPVAAAQGQTARETRGPTRRRAADG